MSRRRGVIAVSLLVAAGGLAGEEAAPPGLTVGRAVELALENSAELAVSRSNAAEGRASARLAGDRFHPQAFVTTTPGYTLGIPSAIVGRVPALAGVEIRSTLFDSGARNEALEAVAREAGLDAELRNAKREAIQATVLAYARCASDSRLLQATREKLA